MIEWGLPSRSLEKKHHFVITWYVHVTTWFHIFGITSITRTRKNITMAEVGFKTGFRHTWERGYPQWSMISAWQSLFKPQNPDENKCCCSNAYNIARDMVTRTSTILPINPASLPSAIITAISKMIPKTSLRFYHEHWSVKIMRP